MVICLERAADCLHMVQLMPLPSQNPIISCLLRVGRSASNNDPAQGLHTLKSGPAFVTGAFYTKCMLGAKLFKIVHCCISSNVTAALSTRSTQPCIPPGSLNRVPASVGVRAGMSPLPRGR